MEVPASGALIAGKYRLARPLGAGGMGSVWVARNETTHADVALKMWHRKDERLATAERFRHEARLASLVRHRNIVQIFDLVDEADGTLALAMELLRGEPLDRCIARRGGLSSLEAIAVLLPILSALAHAHKLGVVHRDVKPANIFLALDTDGSVVPKLVDFGAAKAPAASTSLTIEGHALGTPRYMAPEQIRGSAELDGRADLFAIAVTLVEAVTGASPFEAGTAAATLAAVLEREIDPDPRILPALWVEIARALAKRPFERHTSAAEMAEALRRVSGGSDSELAEALRAIAPPAETAADLAPSTPTELSIGLVPLPARRPRWTWAVAGALAVMVPLGLFVAAQPRARPAPAEVRATREGRGAPSAVASSTAGTQSSARPDAPAPGAPGASASASIEAARAPAARATVAPRPVATPRPHVDPKVTPSVPKRVATEPGF